jgi:hypothetical protein
MTRLISLIAILGITGCSSISPDVTGSQKESEFPIAPSCEPLGSLTARVDCDCYDKMSYDKVRGEATENLRLVARTSYPESNRVEVSSVALYMNSAVAKGTAYRCPAVSSR